MKNELPNLPGVTVKELEEGCLKTREEVSKMSSEEKTQLLKQAHDNMQVNENYSYMNVNEHSIYESIYELCLEIEKIPASEQATKVLTMAGELEKHIRELLKQQGDLQNKNLDRDRLLLKVEDMEKTLGKMATAFTRAAITIEDLESELTKKKLTIEGLEVDLLKRDVAVYRLITHPVESLKNALAKIAPVLQDNTPDDLKQKIKFDTFERIVLTALVQIANGDNTPSEVKEIADKAITDVEKLAQ